MTAYYNEIDPFAAQWLRELIAAGLIAPGEVDERSIEDVRPDDLNGFVQCHFFAGIGIWSLALRMAGWPDGRMTEKYGREVAHASLSARQAKALGLMTSGTFGPHSTGLLSNADLSLLLANRLQARTDCIGSILYRLTWKERITPLGRSIPALRASVLRTSANVCIGWVTPSARDWKDTGEIRPRADGTEQLDQLPRQAFLVGWPTPRVGGNSSPGDAKRAGDKKARLEADVHLTGWPTPKASTAGPDYAIYDRMGTGSPSPATVATFAGWPTPTAIDANRGSLPPRPHDTGVPLTQRVQMATEYRFIPSTIGEMPTGSCAVIQTARASGPLNPAHSLWLMLGPFATAWLKCAEQVTRSTSRRPKPSAKA